jgi:TPR repeat protein
MTDPGELAAIEEGIRAKSAGNIDAALAAWEPVAHRGNSTAQYLVGLLYVTGEANPRTMRTAYAWLSLAAAQGHQLAACELFRLQQKMSQEDLVLARQEAAELAATR